MNLIKSLAIALLGIHMMPVYGMLTLARNTAATQAPGTARALVTRSLSQAAQQKGSFPWSGPREVLTRYKAAKNDEIARKAFEKALYRWASSRAEMVCVNTTRYILDTWWGRLKYTLPVGSFLGAIAVSKFNNTVIDAADRKIISLPAILAGVAIGASAGFFWPLTTPPVLYLTWKDNQRRLKLEQERMAEREAAFQKQEAAFQEQEEELRRRQQLETYVNYGDFEFTEAFWEQLEQRRKNAEEARILIDSCVGVGPVGTLFAILTSPPDLPPLV